MKAKTDTLWETGIEIIVPDSNDEFDKFYDFSDLKKCENVIIGNRDKETGLTEILIDDTIVQVKFRQVTHPTGCGKLNICEVY